MKTKFILTLFISIIFLFVLPIAISPFSKGLVQTAYAADFWGCARPRLLSTSDCLPCGPSDTGESCRATGYHKASYYDCEPGGCTQLNGGACGSDNGGSGACPADCNWSNFDSCSPGGGGGGGEGGTVCSGNACTDCIINAKGGSDFLRFYQDRGWDTACAKQNDIVANWCSSVDPSGCASLKSGTCQSSCGGSSACTAVYILDPSSPPAASAVKVDVSASSPNWDCVALYHDGQVVTNLSADTQRGVYHSSVNSGSAGSSHTLQLKYGVSSVYPTGTACHQPVDCNSTTYQTADSSILTAPQTTITGRPVTVDVGQQATYTAIVTGAISKANIWIARDIKSTSPRTGQRIDATDIAGFDASKFNCPDDGTQNCIWYKLGDESTTAGSFSRSVVFIKPGASYAVIASAEGPPGSSLACSANPYVDRPFTAWGKTYSKCSTSGADVVYAGTPLSMVCDFNDSRSYDDGDITFWKNIFLGFDTDLGRTQKADCSGDGKADLVDFNRWRNSKYLGSIGN